MSHTRTYKKNKDKSSTPFSLIWHYVYEHADKVFDLYLETHINELELDEVEKIVVYENNHVEIHGRRNNVPYKYIAILVNKPVRCIRCNEQEVM